ncbi:hypothetical protein DFH07DRAFT_781318 [Mycena maculata]|uniref:Uncharacterized protein n=1 Tax=Mycena maculata TaxID=230809 RepID=A0AAD7HYY8_9AGAR|nr:hypothetical protein DFH07DRAFT_781318 [Mycena maculata]
MPSPFAPKLGTNYCPQDAEVAEIKALLVEPSLRWKVLNGEIAEMKRVIEKPAQERDTLGNIYGLHSNAPQLCYKCKGGARPPRPHLVFQDKLSQRTKTTRTWLGRSGQCRLSVSFQSAFVRMGFPVDKQDPIYVIQFGLEHTMRDLPPNIMAIVCTSRIIFVKRETRFIHELSQFGADRELHLSGNFDLNTLQCTMAFETHPRIYEMQDLPIREKSTPGCRALVNRVQGAPKGHRQSILFKKAQLAQDRNPASEIGGGWGEDR